MSKLSANRIFDVTDRVCLITGGASGIGQAYAEVLAANGAHVHLLDMQADKLAQTLNLLKGLPGSCWGHQADVTQPTQLQAAIDQVLRTSQRIDVAFINAGIGGGPGFLKGDGSRNLERQLEDLPFEQWSRVMDVNVNGAFLTLQSVVRAMKKSGGGKIIVTTSVSASKTEHLVGTPYVVSKASVAHLVRQAALELVRHHITVNAIAPGPFITHISGGRLQQPEARAPFEQLIPMHRLGEQGDIQGAALFLASDAARYITGASLTVDGGFSLGIAD